MNKLLLKSALWVGVTLLFAVPSYAAVPLSGCLDFAQASEKAFVQRHQGQRLDVVYNAMLSTPALQSTGGAEVWERLTHQVVGQAYQSSRLTKEKQIKKAASDFAMAAYTLCQRSAM